MKFKRLPHFKKTTPTWQITASPDSPTAAPTPKVRSELSSVSADSAQAVRSVRKRLLLLIREASSFDALQARANECGKRSAPRPCRR